MLQGSASQGQARTPETELTLESAASERYVDQVEQTAYLQVEQTAYLHMGDASTAKER